MTTFLAGEKLRASELNSYVLITGRCTADTTWTSNTTLANVTGLSVAVEANATYIWDGYIAYVALSSTPDFKIAVTVPTGTTGHWSIHSMSTGTVLPIGDLDARHATAYGAGTTLTGGTDTIQAAQNTSSATTLTVKTGSWIRFQRVA
jgi:hypothetical protein